MGEEKEFEAMSFEDKARRQEEDVEKYWWRAKLQRGWEREVLISVAESLDDKLRTTVHVRILQLRNFPALPDDVHAILVATRLDNHELSARIEAKAGKPANKKMDILFTFGGERGQVNSSYALRVELCLISSKGDGVPFAHRTFLGKSLSKRKPVPTWLALENNEECNRDRQHELRKILEEAQSFNKIQKIYLSKLVQEEELKCVEELVASKFMSRCELKLQLKPKRRGIRATLFRQQEPMIEVYYCNQKVHEGVLERTGITLDFAAHDFDQMQGDEDLVLVIRWSKRSPSRIVLLGNDDLWQCQRTKVLTLGTAELHLSLAVNTTCKKKKENISIPSFCFPKGVYLVDLVSQTTVFKEDGVSAEIRQRHTRKTRITRIIAPSAVETPVKPKKRVAYVKLWCQRNESYYFCNCEDPADWTWNLNSVDRPILREIDSLVRGNKLRVCVKIQSMLRCWKSRRQSRSARVLRYESDDTELHAKRWQINYLEKEAVGHKLIGRFAAKVLVLGTLYLKEGDVERASICFVKALSGDYSRVIRYAVGKEREAETCELVALALKRTACLTQFSQHIKKELIRYDMLPLCHKLFSALQPSIQTLEGSRDVLIAMGKYNEASTVADECTEFYSLQVQSGSGLETNLIKLFLSKLCEYLLQLKLQDYAAARVTLLQVIRDVEESDLLMTSQVQTIQISLYFQLVALHEQLGEDEATVRLTRAEAYERYASHKRRDDMLLQEDIEEWFKDPRVSHWLLSLVIENCKEQNHIAVALLVESTYCYQGSVTALTSYMGLHDYFDLTLCLINTGSDWLITDILNAMNSLEYRSVMDFSRICRVKDLYETRTPAGKAAFLSRSQTIGYSRSRSHWRRRELKWRVTLLRDVIRQEKMLKQHYARQVKGRVLGPCFRTWQWWTAAVVQEKMRAATMFQCCFHRYRLRLLIKLARERRAKALQMQLKATTRIVHRRNQEIIRCWKLLVERRKALDMLHRVSVRKCGHFLEAWKTVVQQEKKLRNSSARRIQTCFRRFCNRQSHKAHIKTLRRQMNLEVCRGVLLRGIQQNSAAYKVQSFLRETFGTSVGWKTVIQFACQAATRIQSYFRMWKPRCVFLSCKAGVTTFQALFRGRTTRTRLTTLLWNNLRQGTVEWVLQRNHQFNLSRPQRQHKSLKPVKRRLRRRQRRIHAIPQASLSGSAKLRAVYVLPRESQKFKRFAATDRSGEDTQPGSRQVIELPPLRTLK